MIGATVSSRSCFCWINPRRNTPRHILIKLTKIKHKEQILKAAREKQQITHKGIPIRITADLSIETLQARREWQDILKMMKENNLQPRLLYPARISFKYAAAKRGAHRARRGDPGRVTLFFKTLPLPVTELPRQKAGC